MSIDSGEQFAYVFKHVARGQPCFVQARLLASGYLINWIEHLLAVKVSLAHFLVSSKDSRFNEDFKQTCFRAA